jgi:parallel beta-helix repeat protein
MSALSSRLRTLRLIITGAAALSIANFAGSALAATHCVNPDGKHGCSSTIGAAVSAASPGDVIQVSPGVYDEGVTISKSLSLMSTVPLGAVIDATNQANGIWVDGMSAAPNPGVANVVISGFKVRNANYEGILLTNATNVTVEGNEVTDNDRSLDASGGTCPGIDTAFETNEQDDCGEGVHLMGIDHSTILRNEIAHNAGGILISDESGPTAHNLVSENYVHDNVFDCGITLASHGAATTISGAPPAYGVSFNTISTNVSMGNGTQGAGAGVGIFAPFPGTSDTGNLVIHNILWNNGATGVAMHNHAFSPMAPPVNFNNNKIVGNDFSGNGPDNPGAPTSGPTGINISSMAPISGTVVEENIFDKEAIAIGFTAPAGSQVDAHFNNFAQGTGIDNGGAGQIDATENWWGCSTGPGSKHCAIIQGPSVSFTPWLTTPFASIGELTSHHDRH